MDRMLQEAARGGEQGGKRTSSGQSQGGLSEDQIEELEEQFGLDKPVLTAYAQWLGAWPRETRISKGEYGSDGDDLIGGSVDRERTAVVVLKGDGRVVHVTRDGGKLVSAVFAEGDKPVEDEGWSVRIESEHDRQQRFLRRNTGAGGTEGFFGRVRALFGMDVAESAAEVGELPGYLPRAVVYQQQLSGLFQGDLGRSTLYNDPVIDLILARVPVAVYFGLLTAFITYGVCLPLGVLKALKHRTFLDSASSVLVFIGYSIPGFALGALLLVYLGARLRWFPLFGLTSPEFDELGTWEQVKDLAHHTVLPLACYLVGGFAYLTLLTKNSLMDNLASDYIRTAVAKGVGFRRAVVGHAFRNSFIPIATSLGHLVMVFVTGSMLVETVFDIQGFGLLQYQGVLSRDVPVIMGTLVIAALLMLLGNLLSDVIVAFVDPRIKFH